MKEPSILDYILSIVDPRRPRIRISEETEDDLSQIEFNNIPQDAPALRKLVINADKEVESLDINSLNDQDVEDSNISFVSTFRSISFTSLAALFLGLIAQLNFEPLNRNLKIGLLFYLFAFVAVLWAYSRGNWQLAQVHSPIGSQFFNSIRKRILWGAIPFALIAFFAFKGNKFTNFNLLFWIGAIVLFIAVFWEIKEERTRSWIKIGEWLPRTGLNVSISPWVFILICGFGLVIFFRFYQFQQIPAEMFSDHAEKLLDIADVLNGMTRIFFPRNTGREAFQMYLTAAIVKCLGTGLTFTSLKIGTIVAGILTLPFIYLLGVELGNRRAGWIAMVFSGIAYWPNVISRVALRFTFYPFFTAPTLFFLIRGLRTKKINDYILAGIFLGLGLHGYSPFRIVPFIVLTAVFLYWLHNLTEPKVTLNTIKGLAVVVLFSALIFIPLLRFITESEVNYEIFTYRSLSRLTGSEQPLSDSITNLFLNNLWNALTMLGWDNGDIWVHSVINRPALDIVSAALFHIGVILLLVRYISKRNWQDIFLLLVIPLLMMPSILSLAFPAENPSLNRTAGAIIPVFVIIGLALDGFLTGIENMIGNSWGKRLSFFILLFLLTWSSFQNYDLVFKQFNNQYRQGAWNTSEIGKLIQTFSETIGDENSAWVVPYPYWVDTRLVGMQANNPLKDYALFRENLSDTQFYTGPKLFVINLDDQDTVDVLQHLYPNGILRTYRSEVGKDFLMYFVIGN